jgi:hypothetical protein
MVTIITGIAMRTMMMAVIMRRRWWHYHNGPRRRRSDPYPRMVMSIIPMSTTARMVSPALRVSFTYKAD